MDGFETVNDDILQNILFRLPALSFASAAYVSKSWNRVCDRNLCCPKFLSAVSLNPSVSGAVKEVLNKVLSEPIRPQFAIASIGSQFSFEDVHKHLTEKLGSKIPIIITTANGIVGMDDITGTMREVIWYWFVEKDGPVPPEAEEFNRGIVLMIGYLPGLKVDAIPLLRPKGLQVAMVDKFIEDIETYTTKISGHAKPVGILLFGDQHADLHPVIAEIDLAMPKETVVVGDASIRRLMFKSGHDSQKYNLDAVALVLARDRNKPDGIGETQLHSYLDVSIVPFGPELWVTSVEAYEGTNSWLITFSTNGIPFDWGRFWYDVREETKDGYVDFYIGVIQERPSSSERKKMERRSYSAFYEVTAAAGVQIVVKGAGMKPGDRFLFYLSEPIPESPPSDTEGDRDNGRDRVFGNLYLQAHKRADDVVYYDLNMDCDMNGSPFVAGFTANRAIGRHEPVDPATHKAKEERSAPRGIYACTTVYLELSYDPPSPNL